MMLFYRHPLLVSAVNVFGMNGKKGLLQEHIPGSWWKLVQKYDLKSVFLEELVDSNLNKDIPFTVGLSTVIKIAYIIFVEIFSGQKVQDDIDHDDMNIDKLKSGYHDNQ